MKLIHDYADNLFDQIKNQFKKYPADFRGPIGQRQIIPLPLRTYTGFDALSVSVKKSPLGNGLYNIKIQVRNFWDEGLAFDWILRCRNTERPYIDNGNIISLSKFRRKASTDPKDVEINFIKKFTSFCSRFMRSAAEAIEGKEPNKK
jgi:hypothetical protein